MEIKCNQAIVFGKGYINTPRRGLAAHDSLSSKDSFCFLAQGSDPLLSSYEAYLQGLGNPKTLIKIIGQSPSLIRRLKIKFKLSKDACHTVHAPVCSIAMCSSLVVCAQAQKCTRSQAACARAHACSIPTLAAIDPKYIMMPTCHFKLTFQWNSCI